MLTGTLEAGYEGVLFFALNDECGDGPVYGCTDPQAINYNENANTDDGSCDYDIIIDCGANYGDLYTWLKLKKIPIKEAHIFVGFFFLSFSCSSPSSIAPLFLRSVLCTYLRSATATMRSIKFNSPSIPI